MCKLVLTAKTFLVVSNATEMLSAMKCFEEIFADNLWFDFLDVINYCYFKFARLWSTKIIIAYCIFILNPFVRNCCFCLKGAEGKESWKVEMFNALKALLQVLQDDATVSSYELQSTGLVSALLRCLHQVKFECLHKRAEKNYLCSDSVD